MSVQFIISGRNERERKRIEKGKREREARKRQRMMQVREKPRLGWPPVSHDCPIVWKTGFHCAVLTYALKSSFRPWPGPEF